MSGNRWSFDGVNVGVEKAVHQTAMHPTWLFFKQGIWFNSNMVQNIQIENDRIAAFCRKHHIQKLAFFGSILRDDFRPDSDVDVLVSFDPLHSVGFRVFDMEDELSELLGGRKVDLVNEKFLNRHLRARILREAEVRYAES